MSVQYTVQLNNAGEVQAWEQAIAAQVKHDNALKAAAKSYKNTAKEVDELIRELKIEQGIEEGIDRARQEHASAEVRRQKQLADETRRAMDARVLANQRFAESQRIANQQVAEFARTTSLVSRNQQVYSAGGRVPEAASGMNRFASRAMDRWREEQQASRQKWDERMASGMPGLSYPVKHDPWAEGLRQIDSQRTGDSKRRFEAVEAALNNIRRAEEKTFGGRAKAALSSYIGQFATMAGAIGIARLAWDKLSQAQEEYLENSRKVLDHDRKLAGAQQNAMLNLVGIPVERRTKILNEEIPALQGRTAFPEQTQIIEAVNQAYLDTRDPDKALAATETAASVTQLRKELLPLYARMAAAIQSKTKGGKYPEGVSMDQALSFALQVNPHIYDPANVARHLPTVGALSSAAFKDDDNLEAIRAGQAMWTAMTSFTNDPTGDTGTSATNRWLEYSRSFWTDRPDIDPGSLHGRMLKLESDAALQEEFEQDVVRKRGSIEYREAGRELFRKGSESNLLYHSEYDRVNFEVDQLRETREALSSTRAMKIGSSDAQAAAVTQSTYSDPINEKRALNIQARQVADEALSHTNRGLDAIGTWIDRDIATHTRTWFQESVLGADASDMLFKVSERQIRHQLGQRRKSLESNEYWQNNPGIARDKSDIERLERTQAVLEGIREGIDSINKKMSGADDPVQRQPARPSPNPNGAGKQ